MRFSEYKATIKKLKEKCPPAFPVSVRRQKLKELDGTWLDGACSLRDEKFYIQISNKLGEQLAVETLLHEWSHTLAWNYRHDVVCYSGTTEEWDKASHDANWGIAYAEVYRAYMDIED